MEKFYEKLNIPNSCIVDNTIFKKAFLENADLSSTDKKIINEHIKKVVWKYCLKPETINIQPYKSEEREYLEIEIIEVQLNEISKIKRMSEIIMRAIPYPILLVLVKDEKIQLVTGDMRKNLNDNSKVTVEEFVYSDWIDLSSNDEFSNKLLSDLNIKNLSYDNFYQTYLDITAKLNFYNLSKTKGQVLSDDNVSMSANDAKVIYDEILQIDNKILKLKSQIKKAGSIKEKVEINLQIDKLKQEKEVINNKINL